MRRTVTVPVTPGCDDRGRNHPGVGGDHGATRIRSTSRPPPCPRAQVSLRSRREPGGIGTPHPRDRRRRLGRVPQVQPHRPRRRVCL